MSDLRFRCLVDNDFCDIAPFEPYIEKGSPDMGLALIAFDESELDTIKSLLNETQLEGSDGYLYTLSQGSVEKKGKMPHSVMKAYRYYKRYKKKQNRAAANIEKKLSRSGDGIRKVSGGRFSAYKYTDQENKICFPFRLRASKNKNEPLFILLHGAGAMGSDNLKQLFDNLPLYKQLIKTDCNILLPQAPFGSNRGEAMQNYIKSIKRLADKLPIDFDRKRIYIIGTSFGGCCVWQLIYLFPEYFAAAVPVMGSLCPDRRYEKYDIRRLVKTPIWAAHSSDDTNVRIDSDDYCAAELEKLGADIKYTRPDKYGHTMSGKFYRTEKWADWCLSKKSG